MTEFDTERKQKLRSMGTFAEDVTPTGFLYKSIPLKFNGLSMYSYKKLFYKSLFYIPVAFPPASGYIHRLSRLSWPVSNNIYTL